MPVQSPPTKKSSIVHRSESLRSEVSDGSQQSKRVSFNRDVHVKRIPRGSALVDRNGKLVAVLDPESPTSPSAASPNGRLWVNSLAPSTEALPEEDLLREAQTVLQHVDSVTCRRWGSDVRSLDRVKKSPDKLVVIPPSGGGRSAGKLEKSPSRLSDFFSKTLPSQRKSKSESPPLVGTKPSPPPPPPPPKLINNNNSNKNNHNHNGELKEHIINSERNGNSGKKLGRSASTDLHPGQLSGSTLSRSEPNLYSAASAQVVRNSGVNGARFGKVGKIKKPHGTRAALSNNFTTTTESAATSNPAANSNSSSHSSSSSSGSDKESFRPKILTTSDSPVSSLSGPEEPSSMANAPTRSYSSNLHQQPRVSSIVQELSSRRGQGSPERNIPFTRPPIIHESAAGNTHNNNQPFSYISGVANSGSTSNNNSNNNSSSNKSQGSKDRGLSPTKSSSPAKGLTAPKEVIYAQVVVSGKAGEPGVPTEKRTVHTTVMNGSHHRSTPSRAPSYLNSREKSPKGPSSVSPNTIQHFVYDNKKAEIGGSSFPSDRMMSHHHNPEQDRSPFRSSYDHFDFSAAKPRNNVTTVLLNNVEDHDLSFSSPSRDSYVQRKYRSPSPNFRKPEQRFYFGGSPAPTAGDGFGDYNVPTLNNYYGQGPSPSRHHPRDDMSPAFSSSYLVRDAERKKDSILPSAKLVSTFSSNHHNSHRRSPSPLDYEDDYYDGHRMDTPPRSSPARNPNKISYSSSNENLTKSSSNNKLLSSFELSPRYDRYGYDPNKTSRTSQNPVSRSSTPNASNTSVNKLGLRSKENSPAGYRDYRKSSSPSKTTTTTMTAAGGSTTTTLRKDDTSLERKYNKKNKEDGTKTNNAASTLTTTTTTTTAGTGNKKTTTGTTSTSNSNGGGLISTLMRRNKDKKAQKEAVKLEEKEKKDKETPAPEPDGGNNSGLKENKIKRQRAKFLSAFLDKNFSKKHSNNNNINSNNNTTTTTNNSEKLVVEGKNNTKPTDSEIEEAERRRDGEYQSWSSGDDEYRFGHHRNGQLTRGKSYNFGDLNEESESKPWFERNDPDYRHHPSATLGRPGLRSSSGPDSEATRSKSLDRRAYRNQSPPRIIVTPNTPAVEETDKWKSTYDPIIRTFDRDRIQHNNSGSTTARNNNSHSTLTKKVSGLSRSSYELDDPHADHHPMGSDDRRGKLRYFGDTDVEDLNYHHSNPYLDRKSHSAQSRYLPRSSSYLSRGKDHNNYSKYYTVPGSSLNSSGSENGSRLSKGSSNAGSQRSVYLHAPAVADIPATGGMPRRTLSRDELSNYSGHQKQTRHLARSVSVLAPWRPRHYREKYELNYNNSDSKENQPYGRPPKPPRSPTRKSMSPSPGRAGSTESLLKTSGEGLAGGGGGGKSSKNSTLTRQKENVNISRSKSIPKDTRFAGWLRRRRFGKEGKA